MAPAVAVAEQQPKSLAILVIPVIPAVLVSLPRRMRHKIGLILKCPRNLNSSSGI